MDMNKLILVILAILLPPVAVFLHRGMGKDLVLNILLCLFFWLPGVLHALYVITR
ncbi:YqaE/Pmp3 family membrane protein [Marinobacter hydrocarbonoclasticus]|nr:YqaE/Pmp3 family membrane protein [Marinobacter nauticus]